MTACLVATHLPDGPGLSAADTTFRWLARPYELLDECAAAYGDTFTLRFTRFGTHVVVAHPDDVRDVLGADRDVLHAGRGNALLEPVLGRNSLLVVDGDRHLAQRGLLQPAFRSERVAGHAGIVVEATRRATAAWAAGGTVRVQQTALAISREVILRAVFGLDLAGVERIGRLVYDVTALVGTNATFDAGSEETPLHARFHAAHGTLHAALQNHVERRRAGAAPGAEDVLATLLAARTEAGHPLPDEEIRDQLITMILAGHETTASAITWALVCLHAAPDALAAVLRELDAAGAALPDERLAGLPLLQAACLETLRLRPVIPVISREVRRPFRLRDRVVPAGVFVTPCAYLAHRRPGEFPDPDAFRPTRFLERRFAPQVYFPFGGGARRCIGMGFALLEMQMVVGMLLRAFRFAPDGRGPVRPVRRGVTIVASGGGRMTVAPRGGPVG